MIVEKSYTTGMILLSTTVLIEKEQRELLVWFKNNKPELWREIFCDDCPEVC